MIAKPLVWDFHSQHNEYRTNLFMVEYPWTFTPVVLSKEKKLWVLNVNTRYDAELLHSAKTVDEVMAWAQEYHQSQMLGGLFE